MASYGKKYDVIVVGAGHAGCEAALAAARMGVSVLVLTMGLDAVAQMSCNPSIGGLAKGHLVAEVDALGGEMGLNIDATGIQYRRLNTKKGPAVRANRAQADRMAYSQRMKAVVEGEPLLDLKQGTVNELRVCGERVIGVKTREGLEFESRAVVLTTGTFMRGLIHVGLTSYPGGRAGEPAAEGLSGCLRDLGFEVGRLKTGTPARLAARTINFDKLEKQPGDKKIRPFSFATSAINREQVDCHISYTNEATHQIIRNNLSRSALFSGNIEGRGPRYCPSIEDKVVRFPEKNSHQTFIEPEGVLSREMYPSGMSTSLPPDVQLRFFRTMAGLENVEIMRPGYAIEYDFVEPTQLKLTLESKVVDGLYHAGQINGTSGYEEAAAQGLLAGINAALKCQEQEPLVIGREQAYIGVMVDDLVTQPLEEPYRMFTSRSEYRLLLREDNADQRLTPLGRKLGLVSGERWRIYKEKQQMVERGREFLCEQMVTSANQQTVSKFGLGDLKSGLTLEALLRRPEIGLQQLTDEYPELSSMSSAAQEQLEIATKYAGYIERQIDLVKKQRNLESVKLPADIDYQAVPSLSTEVREKLCNIRPVTLGQASRIQGVTPAAIAILNVFLRKKQQ